MGKATFWGQFKALLWKNLLLKKRNKKQTYQEVLMPIYFIIILAMIKAMVKPATFPQIGNFPASPLVDSKFLENFTGRLLISPDTSSSRSVMRESLAILNNNFPNSSFQLSFFDSVNETTLAYKSNTQDVAAGVIFNFDLSRKNQSLAYSIRMPFSDIASTEKENIYKDQSGCRNGNGLDRKSCDVNTYLYTGFSALQTAIDTAIMRVAINKSSIQSPDIEVQMMPKPNFVPDTSYIQILSSIYFVIAYSPFINFLTVNLVAEKEKKIKEGMKMMGLTDAAFWLSWSVLYTVIITIVTVVVIVIAVVSKFFANSNMFLFFLMLLLYGMSIIGASCALTPFFNKAQVAGGMASLASMMISMLYLVVSLTRTYTASGVHYTIPVWGRWLLCFLSPVSLSLAIDQAIYLDIVNPDGMTFSTATLGEFPLIGPIIMLLVDTILYFVLAIYLDNVIPGEYGPRYPPWYIFMPSYWCPGTNEHEASPLTDHLVQQQEDVNVETVPEEMHTNVAVRISKLRKEFDSEEEKVTALNSLSLTIYEDQITAILGHNGAGKTTTFNILTGMTEPTSGYASIMGLNVSNTVDMAKIRSMTGVCPQHNILFDDLTCQEHLQLFAGIKGVTDDNIEEEIKAALNSVGLREQVNVRSKVLSGGQKRKLSVAIAIIGDPKIIFLDEPTAGMDPHSRRHLWSVLKEKKMGRVILLTTHFMDEADILADRKAIINRGSLRCCGSSLFLKSRFGIGYHLNMVVNNDCKVDKIKTFISKYVEGAEINRSHGQEVDVTLPLSQVSNFSGLFGALEENISSNELSNTDNDLGIHNYGVSMTTLEEVFLALEKDTEQMDDLDEKNQTSEPFKKMHIEEDGECKDTTSGSSTSGSSVHVDIGSQEDKSASFHLLDAELDEFNNFEPHFEPGKGSVLTLQRFMGLLKVRFLNNIRNKQLMFFQLVLPVILLVFGLLTSKNSHPELKGKNPSSLPIGPYYYSQMRQVPSPPGRYGPIPSLLIHDNVDTIGSQQFVNQLSAVYSNDTYNTDTPLLEVSPHYIGINLTQFDVTSQGVKACAFTGLYNDSAVHSIPAIVNMMTNSIFKTEEFLSGKTDNSTFISTSSHPWPTDFEKVVYSNAAFSSVILLAMAFTVIPGGFGVEIVKDRQNKVRSQLRISGVSFNLYWGSFFTMDAIKFAIPAILIIIITFVIKVDSLHQGGAVLALVLICATYIPANILFSYTVSFGFDLWETAQAMQPIVFFFGGFIPYLPVALIDALSSETTASLLNVVFCFLLPPYTVFGGLYYIDKVYRTAEQKLSTNNIVFGDYFSPDILVAIFIFQTIAWRLMSPYSFASYEKPVVHVVLNFVLLRVLDVRNTGGTGKEAFCKVKTANSSDDINDDLLENEDDDVSSERDRVKLLQEQHELPVALVSHLSKEFVKSGSNNCCRRRAAKVNVAVNNSSFAVGAGEVLGLLGPNGAGKSTTLSMITADVHPTRGKVVVGGHDIRSSMSHGFQAMGYCPQHDALWDTITLQEHIECYAKIRGIPADKLEEISSFYMDNLKLQEHKRKFAKKLSGGTKRKLSYCMSMLGRPKIVLLDEPSTGMDPQSKRFLWDTISHSFRGSERGAILTTHYMEEADALCSRIAIMVNGKMQCLGSSQHLKNKYGSGYLLEVKLHLDPENLTPSEAGMNKLRQYILGHFPDAVCAEEFNERAQYKIPGNNVKSLASAFTILEKGKQHNDIEEYSFSQSTLEQVFLDFAKHQLDEGAIPDVMAL